MRARSVASAALCAALLAVALAAVAAVRPAPAAAQGLRAAPERLRTFSSCRSLVRVARTSALRARTVAADDEAISVPGPVPEGAGGRDESAAAVGDVSGTNVQEPGVDEPDLVKTDGSVVFAIAGGALHAVSGREDPPRVLDSVRLEGGTDHVLLLHEGRALVIAQEPYREGAPGPVTIVTELDVRDPGALRVVRTLRADGTFVSARRTGPTARLVLSAPPELATADPAAIRRAPLATWLPGGTVRTERTGRRRGRRLVDCSQVRRPRASSGPGILTVLTVDLRRGLPWVDADAVMTDAQVVYGSPRSLYVATRAWTGTAAGATQIHRFAAAEAPETAYRATGSVPGGLLNQFALSEHEGVLRVASTLEPGDPGAGDEESSSLVTVLAEAGSTLRAVGSVGDLGRGERIFAVRFLGEVGYVVTFRQTDPLYTIDLSAPQAPRVTGELKIRGYSAYLHPVGPGLLLGVGQDATAEGRTLGTQLSLFDVSRPEAPVRLHQRTLGGAGTSEVEYDHRAFLYWAPTRLAVLPFETYGTEAAPPSASAAGFRVDPAAGIEEVGRVQHPEDRGRTASIRRSVVVGERLLTLSDRGLLASDLATLAPRAWVPLGR